MNTREPHRWLSLRRIVGTFSLGLLMAVSLDAATPAASGFAGRWALDLPEGRAGWLKIEPQEGWNDGSLLWGGGSVLPLANVVIADGRLTATQVREVQRKNSAGEVVRTQQLTNVLEAQVSGDTLKGTFTIPRLQGDGFDRSEFKGKRIPALPPRPDLTKVQWGEPITLFNGRDLKGWRLIEPQAVNGWVVESGALVNRPVQVEGQPQKRYGNIRTDREFEDFNLKLDVNVPAHSNSGIYLRGIYEVQVFDSYGKAPTSSGMGAIYSRIVPKKSAEKPAGEWQSMDITLLDRHVTVVLNGVTIIDNEPVEGCTGGALWSDEFRPGPIYLQGDHGAVDYRNMVLRPIVKK
jgi:hypothetical protein